LGFRFNIKYKEIVFIFETFKIKSLIERGTRIHNWFAGLPPFRERRNQSKKGLTAQSKVNIWPLPLSKSQTNLFPRRGSYFRRLFFEKHT
jgi:hypothetical protein